MVISPTGIQPELRVHLMIDAFGKILEERSRRRIVCEIAYRTGAAERPGHVWQAPDVVGQNLRRRWVETAERVNPSRKWIARPGAVRVLTRGRRIVEWLTQTAESEISFQFVRRRGAAGIGPSLLLDQFTIAGIPERPVAAVINMRDHHRTSAVSIRHHEPGRHAV